MTGPTSERRHSTLFVLVVAFFAASLIVSNIIAVKPVLLFGLILPAASLIFPITYILGDVLTEVYGYGSARQAIWIGFACNLLASLAILLGLYLPAAEGWPGQESYAAILGAQPRILLASFLAFLVGGFVNSYVLARMKIWTKGRHLWARTIGSTFLGQGFDTMLFVTIAFYGIWDNDMILVVILSQWLFKVAYEALATPLTYAVVGILKRVEGSDVFDRDTRFSPFTLSER
jgi:queuosine precursor transporter